MPQNKSHVAPKVGDEALEVVGVVEDLLGVPVVEVHELRRQRPRSVREPVEDVVLPAGPREEPQFELGPLASRQARRPPGQSVPVELVEFSVAVQEVSVTGSVLLLVQLSLPNFYV